MQAILVLFSLFALGLIPFFFKKQMDDAQTPFGPPCCAPTTQSGLENYILDQIYQITSVKVTFGLYMWKQFDALLENNKRKPLIFID